MAYKRENLVVLMFADNECYTDVVLPDDPKVKKSRAVIEENKGTWTAPHPSDPALAPQTRKIGESRYFEHGSRWGVIGVYDRTLLNHLAAMVSAGCGATDRTSPHEVD
ncbi:MAG: hypothetical protein AAB655_02105 [Patescibacteria group bacterium]